MGQDLNWREHMLQALQKGEVTAIITFDDVTYRITMEPMEPMEPHKLPTASLGAHKKAICGLCGEIIILEEGAKNWYHKEAQYGNHLAHPQWETRPKTEAAAPAATPVESSTETRPLQMAANTYQLWEVRLCSVCNEEIRYVRPYWEHLHGSPRHPAVPYIL